MEPEEVKDGLVRERERLEQGQPDASSLEQVEAELADVEQALRRLDEGSYGTCEVCGGPITDARLEAHPAARVCDRHASPPEPPPSPT